MSILVSDIEQTIRLLTGTVRAFYTSSKATSAQGAAWWVLVCGEALGQNSLAERDAARERLRQQLLLHDIALREHVWIWDETNRAQILVDQYANKNDAETLAETLREKGLDVRVVREWRE